MKIWIRYLLGLTTGLIIALFFVDPVSASSEVWLDLSELAVRVGRYLLLPLVFFGTLVSVHDLREHKQALSTWTLLIILIVVLPALAVTVGAIALLFFQPGVLPIILEDAVLQETPDILSILGVIFPDNALSVLTGPGRNLLAAVILGAMTGMTMSTDRRFAGLLEDIADALCRLFFRLNAVIVQLFGIGLLAITVATVLRFRNLGNLEFYAPMILVISFTAGVVTLGLYPLLVWGFGRKWNPLLWMYSMIAPGLAALVSGDVFLAGGTLAYTGRHNIGVRREVGGSALPLALMFARAGSAMVSAMAFIMVLRSFSGLELGIASVIRVVVMSFGFSFLLPAVPAGGVLVLLSMLASGYSQGFEDAYLILRPAAPILLSIAAYVDVMTAGVVMHIVAGRRKLRDLPDTADMV